MIGPCVSCHRAGLLNEDYQCAVCVAQPVCTTVPANDLAADVAPAVPGGRAALAREGRALWRKFEGSQRHPGSEDTRWRHERNVWLWFRAHGTELLDALEETCCQ
jgi:hypothetical protein